MSKPDAVQRFDPAEKRVLPASQIKVPMPKVERPRDAVSGAGSKK